MGRDKERKISSEQILYTLLNISEDEAKKREYVKTYVDRVNSKTMGIFSYKLKDTAELKMGRFFLIKELQDGKEVNLIYDEHGKLMSSQKEGEDLKVPNDIELNEYIIKQQLENERQRIENSGETNAGNGRDIASKEHESKEKKEQDINNKKEEKQQENNNQANVEEDKDKLKNLKGKVNVQPGLITYLDQMVNGNELWKVLGIEEKLAGKLPDGVTAKDFRTGFLTIVNSSELTALDGKERKWEKSFAIQTRDGDLVELDENVIIPMNKGTRKQNLQAEQTSINKENGEEVDRSQSDTETELPVTGMYEIPGVKDRFNVNENWYLETGKDLKWMKNSNVRPEGGNIDNMYFSAVDRNTNPYERGDDNERTIPQERVKIELEPRNDPRETAKEQLQREELERKDSNEAKGAQKEHMQGIAEKIKSENVNWNECFDTEEKLLKKIDQLHDQGKNDEEIEKIIVDEIEYTEEFYMHLGQRPH